MRRLMTALTVLFFAACGDAPSGVDAIPDGPLQMALVSGGDQEVTVTDTLPSDIVVRVEKGGQPLADQLVDWKVLADNCGSPFVTTTRTDSSGVTGNRLVAGTRAWTHPDVGRTCQMEVRYALVVSDTVQAQVDTTVDYLVMPGPFREVRVGAGEFYSSTDTLWIINEWVDQYGNDIPPSSWRMATRDTALVEITQPDSLNALDPTYNSARIVPRDTGTAWLELVVGDTIRPIALEVPIVRRSDTLVIDEATFREP